MPLVDTTYQTLLRMPLDGSTVLSQSCSPPALNPLRHSRSIRNLADGSFSTPLLPQTPLATIGNGYALHVTAQDTIDQTVRFGGIAGTSPANASVPITFNIAH